MPELRKDPVGGRRGIISTERSRRPTNFTTTPPRRTSTARPHPPPSQLPPARPEPTPDRLPVLSRQRGHDPTRGVRAPARASAAQWARLAGPRGAEQVPRAPDRGHARPPRRGALRQDEWY